MKLFVLILLTLSFALSQKYSWVEQNSGVKASFRGISVVNESICWVSGTNGTIIKTEDGGTTWNKLSVPVGGDSIDFRDIQAFTNKLAYIMGAGPGKSSVIYKTVDGGKSWNLQFTNTYKEGFFTAISFWNESHGIVLSDPVEGTHYILTTTDGGSSWNRVDPNSIPKTIKDEYGFAASGTNMTIREGGHAWIGSGGSRARVYYSNDYGKSWVLSAKTPIQQGKPSKGIFSLTFTSDTYGVAVGGDYSKSEIAENCIIISNDGGITWNLTDNPKELVYHSCIREFPESKNLLAVGRRGSSYSTNRGKTWNKISDLGLYTMDIGGNDKSVWAAGPKGRVAKLKTN